MNPASFNNPKRPRKPLGREAWYPYYAGFSQAFAASVLSEAKLTQDNCVLDPWNGAGTTTAVANASGVKSFGVDVNPASVLIAKARTFPLADAGSLAPLAAAIINFVDNTELLSDDPLLFWFSHNAARHLRRMQISTKRLLAESLSETHFSAIAAFFYVLLFRVVRRALKPHKLSNPTWVKRSVEPELLISLSEAQIEHFYWDELEDMQKAFESERDSFLPNGQCNVTIGLSQALPLASASVDLVLSSPPYCTRIDYAISTMPELALIGFSLGDKLRELRNNTLGTSTIHSSHAAREDAWGSTCETTLCKIESHSSKASKAYYFRTYLQYFSGLYQSFIELSRCLKSNSTCCLVVQDSFYKDVRIDLATITKEMAEGFGFVQVGRKDFEVKRSFAGVHAHVRKYRTSTFACESILCLTRG